MLLLVNAVLALLHLVLLRIKNLVHLQQLPQTLENLCRFLRAFRKIPFRRVRVFVPPRPAVIITIIRNRRGTEVETVEKQKVLYQVYQVQRQKRRECSAATI